MTAAVRTPVDVALSLADRGWPVLPVERDKAPVRRLVPNGVDDATTNPDTIRRWWTARPDSGVAVDLARSNLLAVDPDSDLARAEAHKLGLSPTIIRRSRQDAYLYLRPANCPAARVTNRGASGKLDVLGSGYLVIYGTHAEGHAITLEGDTPAEPPAWPVEWLKEAAAARERKRAVARTQTETEDDGPPVELDTYGLAVWRGERVAPHKDDQGRPIPNSVNRSSSLVKLGRVLYDAGATRRTIVQALAERDEALGWHKFSNRPDADRQYHAVVDELEDKGRNAPHTWPKLEATSAPTNGSRNGNGRHDTAACSDVCPWKPIAEQRAVRIAELESILATLGAELAGYRDRETGARELRQTKAWSGKEKQVIEHLAEYADRQRRSGKAEAPLYLPKDGKLSGTSASTTNRVVARLRDYQEQLGRQPEAAAFPPLPIRFREGRTKNDRPQIIMEIEPTSRPGRDMTLLARIPRPEELRNHGGARLRCRNGCKADLIVTRTTTWTCEECGEVAHEENARPKRVAPFQDEMENRPPTPPVVERAQLETEPIIDSVAMVDGLIERARARNAVIVGTRARPDPTPFHHETGTPPALRTCPDCRGPTDHPYQHRCGRCFAAKQPNFSTPRLPGGSP